MLLFVVSSGGLAVFLTVGLVGLYRYVSSFWLYRGFPPPHDPAFVKEFGSFHEIRVTSAGLGGRKLGVCLRHGCLRAAAT